MAFAPCYSMPAAPKPPAVAAATVRLVGPVSTVCRRLRQLASQQFPANQRDTHQPS